MRIPIAIKLIIMTITLLAGVTTSIALKSSDQFAKEATAREESVNLDMAISKQKEVESILSGYRDKVKVSANLLMKSNSVKTSDAKVDENSDFEINFKMEKRIYALEIVKLDGTSVTSVARKIKTDSLSSYNLPNKFFDQVRASQKFPYRLITQGHTVIKNGSLPKGPPLFTIGLPLIKNDQGLITHIALADVDLSVIQKPFGDQAANIYFMFDDSGELLAHAEEAKAISRLNVKNSAIVEAALDPKKMAQQKQIKFVDEDDQEFRGAYVKTSFGTTVVSMISSETILGPAKKVKRTAFFILGLFMSGSIFFVFLFSMSLTSPLETLVSLIRVVSKGNFDVKASHEVKMILKDEVSELAIAFDQMTDGLKERDKVKSLFSKFHGSSVADDLIKNNIGVGGQNKDVVVFFSDIRGFTAFSEKRSPEEVVEMLNEYFGAMVKVINQYGGVVDKFIGDAIMAVWGAPKTSDRDAHNALRACIEMRKVLAELNEKRIARGQPPINIGMGLHSGRAISGTIGSDERMEYTVIGNTVNTASRIEASTKAFGADLLVSGEVVEKVGEDFLIELAGSAEVKGRSDALKLYRVRGFKNLENGEYVTVKTDYSDYEAEKADKVKISA